MKFRSVLSLSALAVVSFAAAQVTITQVTAFGTSGQVAPGAVANLGTGSLERGMAYNPATGNTIYISRNGGVSANVLNSSTGALIDTEVIDGQLTGGTFKGSTIGISSDGQIFVANLATNSSTANSFKIYRYASEADLLAGTAPTLYYNAAGLLANRLGDSLDVRGTGNNVEIVAGYSGAQGYAKFTETAGVVTASSVPGNASGDFRLGITYAGGSDVFGTQGTNLRSITLDGTVNTTALLNGTWAPGERLLDYAVYEGTGFLATADTGSNIVKIWEQTAVNQLTLRTSIDPSFTDTANGNGTGSIQWGAYNSGTKTAELYVMNTNNGIAKYTVQGVPEPASMAVLGLGLAAFRRRRAVKK